MVFLRKHKPCYDPDEIRCSWPAPPACTLQLSSCRTSDHQDNDRPLTWCSPTPVRRLARRAWFAFGRAWMVPQAWVPGLPPEQMSPALPCPTPSPRHVPDTRPIVWFRRAPNHPCRLSLVHISEPTRRTPISYAVFCLKKKEG